MLSLWRSRSSCNSASARASAALRAASLCALACSHTSGTQQVKKHDIRRCPRAHNDHSRRATKRGDTMPQYTWAMRSSKLRSIWVMASARDCSLECRRFEYLHSAKDGARDVKQGKHSESSGDHTRSVLCKMMPTVQRARRDECCVHAPKTKLNAAMPARVTRLRVVQGGDGLRSRCLQLQNVLCGRLLHGPHSCCSCLLGRSQLHLVLLLPLPDLHTSRIMRGTSGREPVG